MCCFFILKALHWSGCVVRHVFATIFIKYCKSIMSSQVISKYLYIYSCNIKVALPNHVTCHNDLFKGKIHSLITMLNSQCAPNKSLHRFCPMPYTKKFPFHLEFFGKYWIRLSSSKRETEREIHHFSASKVRRLCKPEEKYSSKLKYNDCD